MKLLTNLDKNQIINLVVDQIISLIKTKKNAILGLATGNTMIDVYKSLAIKGKNLDWSSIITFNLDEYVNVQADSPISYQYYMKKYLFSHVNINYDNVFFPTQENYQNYDNLIDKKGGIDIQLLGVGVNGHIAFNEPNSSVDSITRVINLTKNTIEVNAKIVGDINKTPKKAYSMGIKTILKAKQIYCIAFGSSKLNAIKAVKKMKVTPFWPITYLILHANATVLTDLDI